MNTAQRPKGHWPAWMDEVLAFPPIAELEPTWQAAIAHAITRALDQRNGTVVPATCKDCGSLLVLGCRIVGCGLPPLSRRRRIRRWLERQYWKRRVKVRA